MSRGRLRLPLGVAIVAVVVVGFAPSAAGATTSKPLTGRSGPLEVTLTPPPTHAPKIDTNVPISVVATVNGKPAAHASAEYEFVYGGAVVATQYPNGNKHFTFTGRFSDDLVFPPSAVGEPLTLRFVIRADGHSVSVNWAITAKK